MDAGGTGVVVHEETVLEIGAAFRTEARRLEDLIGALAGRMVTHPALGDPASADYAGELTLRLVEQEDPLRSDALIAGVVRLIGDAPTSRGAHTCGQFVVQVAGRDGRRHLAPHVVAFHDTPAGRHLRLRRGDWVTLLPASTAQVAGRIREVVDEALAVRWVS